MLFMSVLLFVVVPLVAGVLTRRALIARGGEGRVQRLGAALKPWSIGGLLMTVVLLFAFQAETIVAEPTRVAMIAVPLRIQGYGIFFIAYLAARWLRLPHPIAAPAALIGTSNFFELAVAIGLFGLGSGAALATVVGVLIEVPVMLSLVVFSDRTRRWFPAA